MAFTRHLGDPFVDALNDCYQREGSWWRRIADDPDVFIAIRDGYLNVYVSGGSLLRVSHTRSEGLVCSICWSACNNDPPGESSASRP